MSQARTKLNERLKAIETCLSDACVQNGAPADKTKNTTAALFRNGLAVLQFATIEAFVKERSGELLSSFQSATVKFSNLSEKLQEAVTLHALQGILYQAKLQDSSNQISWTLTALPAVTNAPTHISNLSPYSFGHNQPNISHEAIPKILSAFGVEGGWTTVAEIAKRVGVGGVHDYSQAYKDLANRRHSAAHDITIVTNHNDLVDAIVSTKGICCALDLLLSHAVSRHNLGIFPNKTNGLVKHSDLKIRFISPHPTKSGQFREQTRTGAKLYTVKVHSTLNSATTSALSKVHEHLVILDMKGLPEQWQSW